MIWLGIGIAVLVIAFLGILGVSFLTIMFAALTNEFRDEDFD